MPYNSYSIGLFEYIHSMPVTCSWNIIKHAFECLENTIYKMNVRNTDTQTIDRYIDDKVYKNIERIKESKKISSLLRYDILEINGERYKNLQCFDEYLTKDYLQKIFENDTYSTIHGDLTIENIICTRLSGENDSFYIIDPNTVNIHDSSNLDYAKLLQSIHGGYEFLMSVREVSVDVNRINFLFTRSSAYTELYKNFKEYMLQTFSDERVRSIYFHEIIHWLRLMPYKIEKDEKRAVIFYAGMIIVLNDVIGMYGELK